MTISDIERMMKYVDKTDGCWIWTGRPANTGYGQFGFIAGNKRKVRNPHRIIYELYIGEIKGETLDHLCRNRLCVNPKHLEPVTIGENVLRGNTIASYNKAKTRCKHGHEFTPENTYYFGKNKKQRQCITCRNQRKQTHRRKKSNGLHEFLCH